MSGHCIDMAERGRGFAACGRLSDRFLKLGNRFFVSGLLFVSLAKIVMREEIVTHLECPHALLYRLVVLAREQVMPHKMCVESRVQRIDFNETSAFIQSFRCAAKRN